MSSHARTRRHAECETEGQSGRSVSDRPETVIGHKYSEAQNWLSVVYCCIQGTKKSYRTPVFRGNSTADPSDILSPQFDNCSVPLVWWPWWPDNPADFFLTSLAPLHAMLTDGTIDKSIRYTPVMEGLSQPGYFRFYFEPISNFPVSFLLVGASLILHLSQACSTNTYQCWHL